MGGPILLRGRSGREVVDDVIRSVPALLVLNRRRRLPDVLQLLRQSVLLLQINTVIYRISTPSQYLYRNQQTTPSSFLSYSQSSRLPYSSSSPTATVLLPSSITPVLERVLPCSPIIVNQHHPYAGPTVTPIHIETKAGSGLSPGPPPLLRSRLPRWSWWWWRRSDGPTSTSPAS